MDVQGHTLSEGPLGHGLYRVILSIKAHGSWAVSHSQLRLLGHGYAAHCPGVILPAVVFTKGCTHFVNLLTQNTLQCVWKLFSAGVRDCRLVGLCSVYVGHQVLSPSSCKAATPRHCTPSPGPECFKKNLQWLARRSTREGWALSFHVAEPGTTYDPSPTKKDF